MKITRDSSQLQRNERNKLFAIKNLLKQYGKETLVKGDVLFYNGKSYDSYEAVKLLNASNDINNEQPVDKQVSLLPENNNISRKRAREENMIRSSKFPRVNTMDKYMLQNKASQNTEEMNE